ncbi:aminoglycoside phosphotransferase family protein [bacterium]|nr:aminoglycoside phosphotransferase family protein [bacterium]
MNKDIYLSKISSNFPEVAGKKIEVIEQKDKDLVFLDKKIVFVFPKNIEAKNNLIRAIDMSLFLSPNITLPISNFTYIPEKKDFAGYNYINGECLSIENFKKLNLHEQDIIANQLSIFLNELHSSSLPMCRKNGIKQGSDEEDVLDLSLKKICTLKKKISEKDIKYLEKLLDDFSKKRKKIYKFVLSHRKLNEQHIIIDYKKCIISGVLNFNHLEIDDPAVDFASLWDYGESFVDKVLYGYFLGSNELKERSFRWYIYNCISEDRLSFLKQEQIL